jgi:hypothetical protein
MLEYKCSAFRRKMLVILIGGRSTRLDGPLSVLHLGLHV